MRKKPTYEELELRVKELETALAGAKRDKEMVQEAQDIMQLLNSTPFGLYLIDLSGKIVTCNRSGAERLGTTVKGSAGKVLREYFPSEVSEDRRLKGLEAIQLRQAVSFEDQVEGRWYRNSICPLFDREASPVRFAICGADVTEYKKALKASEESEEKYRQLADLLPQVVFETDKNGNLTFTSHMAFELFGYTRADFEKGLNALQMLIPEDRERAAGNMQAVFWNKKSGGTEYTALTKNGRTYPVMIYSSPVISEGKPVGLRGIIIDLSEVKRAEEALRESESNLQSVFDAVPVGICFMKDRVYQRANQNWCDSFGYPEESLIGKAPAFLYESMEEYERVGKELYGSLIEDGMASAHTRLKRSDGKFRDVVLMAKPLNSQDIEAGFVTVVHDITEHKRVEEEKNRLEDQLRQAQKMEAIGTLAGGIAHDFNNILGIILGNTELAMDDIPEWNPASKNLEEVRKACLRAKEAVRQILSFSRKTDAEQKPVNIAAVVADSLNLLRSSIPVNIDIRRNIADDLLHILGDPNQIHQIMMNLCTNAAQAMENEGGVLEVSVENREMDEEDTLSRYRGLTSGPHVQLCVRDTGDGVSSEVIDRIFDPYFTTKEVGKGTGLGLSVVYGIVKSHHGRISVESNPGKGTIFNILFPAIKNTARDETKESRELPTGKETILLVDDEPLMVKLNQQRLERLGYKVVPKTDSSEALAFFLADPDQIDLIITDMTMPHMTGDRMAQEILRIRSDMPIILCTGYSQRVTDKKARKIGIRKYIEKPIEMENLARSVREVLDSGTNGSKAIIEGCEESR